MRLTIDFWDWANSNYGCDSAFISHRKASAHFKKNTEDYEKYAIPSDKLLEAHNTSRYVGLIDTISQLSKATLELILWPVAGVGFVGFAFVATSMQIYKGEISEAAAAAGAYVLSSIFYSPASIVNRIRVIVVDIFGACNLIEPYTAALARNSAFESFPFHGQSLLLTVCNILRCDPYGEKYSKELYERNKKSD